jgi:RNA polymerase sigma-70 factor (ECF subfamily)
MRLHADGTVSLGLVAVSGVHAVTPMREHQAQRAEVAAREVAHDEALLTAVYNAHSVAIHSYAFRLLGNQEDADDVTQEVFIRAHQRLDQLRDPHRLRPWLYRIATNLCMDLLRKRSRVRRILGIPIHLDADRDEGDEGGVYEIAEPGSAEVFDGIAEIDHISRALRTMAPKYATCLVLHGAQGLSYREIAEILGITPGAAAVRLARARDMFARCYDEQRKEECS